MTTTSEPGFVAQTLAWCNDRRAEKGKEPLERLPKGKRTDPRSCPCGQACGLIVSAIHYRYPGEPDGWLELPMAVVNFVDAFDDGDLPQYDEAAS